MGGNVKLETGERAEKIKIGMMNSELFNAYKNEIFVMLENINIAYTKRFGEMLWYEFYELFSTCGIFSGSARLMFNKPFSQFALYKPTVGDIDVQVPSDYMGDLKIFLEENKNKKFGHFKYLGFTNVGVQLNCLFESPDEFKDYSKYIQLDFEGTEFVNNRPTTFSSFGHYSSWTDVKEGIKGFASKYLLRSLVAGISKDEITVLSSKTKKPIKCKPKENFYGFSVDKGFREKFKPNLDENNNHIKINDKLSYFKIEPKDAKYITDLEKIFSLIFYKLPDENEKYALFSFVKTLELMKAYCAESNIESVFEDFVELLWGNEAQRIERDNPSIDNIEKTKMHNMFIKVFPKLKKIKIKAMKNSYYKTYKIS